MSGQEPASDFIQEILRHINGVLYTDRTTGTYKIKLIRDDYVVGNLPVFDESNILELGSFQRPAFAEMVNEIEIAFTPRGDTKDTVLTFQDSASIDAQGGIISQTINYPGIDSFDTATKVGMRELRLHSTPLAQVELKVNRDGWDINPGDPIVMNWSDYGVTSMVLRVMRVNYGSLDNSEITLSCIEDVFGLPSNTYVSTQESQWTDFVVDPADISDAKLVELPYFEIATGGVFGDAGWIAAQTVESASGFLVFMADSSISSPDYQLWVDANDGSGYQGTGVVGFYTPTVTLTNDLNYTDTTDIATSTMPAEADNVEVGDYAFLDDEIVRVDAIDTTNNLVTLGRGCLDTIPDSHSAGATLWFGKEHWAIDETAHTTPTTVDAKALVQTSKGVLDIGSATEYTLSMVGRQYKPYPVANVTFGDQDWSFPSEMYGGISGLQGMQLNWVDRNRLTQVTQHDILDWYDAGVTVEPSTTYTLTLYGEMNLYTSTADKTVDPAGGNTYDWSTEIADSNLYYYNPPDIYDANATLQPDIQAALGKDQVVRSGTTTTFTGTRSMTYSGGWAQFNGTDSYIDLCTTVTGQGYRSISLKFNPTDSGADQQTIIGFYGDNQPVGSTFGPLLVIGWKRSTQAITIQVGANYTPTEVVGYARPGVNNEIYIKHREYVAPPGEVGGLVEIWMNGHLISNTVGTATFSTPSKPIMLGSGYQSDESTRDYYFSGKMTDFRMWEKLNDTDVDEDDIWDTSGPKRANASFRAKIVTERGGVESLQTFDYIVPNRYGWGLGFGDKWNGRY
jgi:hypothetical protein